MDAATFLSQQPTSVADMVCQKCQEYQKKYNSHPDVVALNIKLKEQLLRELQEQQRMICGTLVFFNVTKQQEDQLTGKNLLIMSDFFNKKELTL